MSELNGTGAVGGNSQNIPQAHVPRTSSSFPLRGHRLNTERYGEYTPIFAFESIKEDKLPFRTSHSLLSYTMKKPLMQEVSKIKDLFSVPMEAILPLNWEKYFDNPVRGDDVNDDVGPAIPNFWNKAGSIVSTLFSKLNTLLADSGTTDALALQATLRFLVIGEMFYSNGSLMSSLGCHGSSYFRYYDSGVTPIKYYSWDQLFDSTISTILSQIDGFTLQQISVGTYSVVKDFDFKYDNYEGYVPFNHALCLMRDDPTCYIDQITLKSGASAGSLVSLLKVHFTGTTFSINNANIPFNTQFLTAYQLCCAHYYSNDHVDFVYSAELYRQLVGHYYYLARGTSNTETFTRNGIKYEYDYLSGHVFGTMQTWMVNNSYAPLILTVQAAAGDANVRTRALLGYLSAIFSYRRSLKYLDYFSGSRTQPLAVAGVAGSPTDTSVAVSANKVSVIDITKSIQAQRFLNSVNRIGHQFEKYLKGIFGGRMPAPDYHNPFHLAHIQDTVYADETQNTGDAQLDPQTGTGADFAITTNLRSNSSKYMFEIDSDRPCVIIAIGHYDVPRIHFTTMDRSFLHENRFDYFNPFMQYVGDQPVYLHELGIQTTLDTTLSNFGYAMRHMEYKQLFNSAAGGFVENLPGFCFPASDRRGTVQTLGPEWIRCVQSEFDYFYTSLTGHSLGSYFHFIVDNYIDMSGSRPMAYSPQILG